VKTLFLFAGVLAVLVTLPALADDHMITPQCWEENKDGQVYRHCEVHRDARDKSSVPAPYPPLPGQVATMMAPLPMRAWPSSQLCAYGPPCPVYYDYRPAPPIPPLYGPPPYYGPPVMVFRFGPFSFWVP
jgi:hypothetical protein